MKTQTSLVSQQVRLQQWAEKIKGCQSRLAGMNVDAWCKKNDITKVNYYLLSRGISAVDFIRKAFKAFFAKSIPYRLFCHAMIDRYNKNHFDIQFA